MAALLPRIVVIRSSNHDDLGYAHYKEGGPVRFGEESVFSPLVKIEIERATVNDKYVHLRFTHSNRYWAAGSTDAKFIVAESDQPEEDATEQSCTMFEPIIVDADNHMFYLKHVSSEGGRVMVDWTKGLHVNWDAGDKDGYLSYTDSDTLIKLPAHVAFKGDNGKYLRAHEEKGRHMQFGSEDPNDIYSGHTVHLMPDGHVRIFSDHFGMFLWMEWDWIYGDWGEHMGLDCSLFWPVRIDDNTIALRCKGNGKFCSRDWNDYLAPNAKTMSRQTRIEVEELVLERKIYHVKYRMEDARILGETPYLAGTSRLTNDTDEADTMAVSITYQDTKSYTFSRGTSFKAGVSTTISGGVPLIGEASITVSFEINESLQWDTTATTTTSVTALGTIPVPARSAAVIDYVGTRGTCNIPYSYIQEDRSSTDGRIVRTQEVDGIYNGVSCYNFDFKVRSLRSLI